MPNKYFILKILQILDDTPGTLFSSYSPVLCYPAQSRSFVCLHPFSPMKGNWIQRLQLVRQLDSCFVSSTHPLSHTLIAILPLPSLICPSLGLLRFVFFNLSSGVVFWMKQRLSDIHWNVFSPFMIQKLFINPSTVHLYHSSLMFLSTCLSVSSSLSTEARIVIHH